MTIPRIVGQDRAVATVCRLSAHTLLFTGPDGVGRRTLARWYAALLNCRLGGERPCEGCDSCLAFEYGHPDYLEVRPESATAAGRRARRPEIRIGDLVPRPGGKQLPLSRWLEQRPKFQRRVGVIDGAHSLTHSAANAFLKMLEEPPSYAVIILIAPSQPSVLPTVASRCTPVHLGPVDTSGFEDLSYLPAFRLGHIGPLLQARADPKAARELRDLVEAYVAATKHDLEASFEASDRLEKRWLNGDENLFGVLLERLRQAPPGTYLAASEALDRCQGRLEAYTPSSLAFLELTLALRNLLRPSSGLVATGEGS